jgi:tetratricopeptide (TPR) repeat protein
VSGEVLEPLTALLDNSLLRREQRPGNEPRFRMLETVREYAAELLEPDDARSLRGRHAAYYAGFAARMQPLLLGPECEAAVERIADDHDNLRALLAHALAEDLEIGFTATGALRRYWEMAARGREIRAWLEAALPRADAPATRTRTGAELVLGRQLVDAGEYAKAEQIFELALGRARAQEWTGEAAVALTQLAWLRLAAGDESAALPLAEGAVEAARAANDLWSERLGLAMHAGALLELGEVDRAREGFDDSLTVARRLGDRRAVVMAMANSGFVAMRVGDLAAARSVLDEALRLSEELDHPVSTVAVLSLRGAVANLGGDHEEAKVFLLETLARGRDAGRPIHLLEALTELALALADTEPLRATRLLGAADAGYAERAIVRPEAESARFEALRAELAASLGEHQFAEVLVAGSRLTITEAIEEALQPATT